MKKLLGGIVGALLLVSCIFEGTIIDAYYIVCSVEKVEATAGSGNKKYKVIATYNGNSKVVYYTNTIYTVGDTLRMK